MSRRVASRRVASYLVSSKCRISTSAGDDSIFVNAGARDVSDLTTSRRKFIRKKNSTTEIPSGEEGTSHSPHTHTHAHHQKISIDFRVFFLGGVSN